MSDSRHVVNFALLLSFGTLAVSGGLSFVQPFSLVTTRVHIVFGLTTFVLVGMHLAARIPYFRSQLKKAGHERRLATQLSVILLGWAALFYASLANREPTSSLIAQSYEQRHRAEIVRGSPLAGFLHQDAAHVIHRQPGPEADVEVSLLVRLQDTDPTVAIAAWAETTTGTMIETLYIDPTLAYSDRPTWNGVATPREQILPIWRNRYTAVSGVEPSGEIDAATGATASHSFSLTDYLELGESKEFILCVELNAVGDKNEHFSDDHVGQPSLLYTALISVDEPAKYVLLELTGHGGGAETSGAIQYDLDQITSAKQLLDLALAKVSQTF